MKILKNKKTYDIIEKIYIKLMIFGKKVGCHQIPERSFAVKGYQFPICARCFGVMVGYAITIPCVFLFGKDIVLYIIFMFLMFLDWFVQYIEICESTNIRRFVTGVLGGYGVFGTEIYILSFIFKTVRNF